MKRLTRSEDCSDIKVDSLYLPWTMMKWNFVGEIREYNIDKSNLCSTTDNSVLVFFPSKGGEGVKNTILTSSFFNPSFHNFFFIYRTIPMGRVYGYLSQAKQGPNPALQHVGGAGGFAPAVK